MYKFLILIALSSILFILSTSIYVPLLQRGYSVDTSPPDTYFTDFGVNLLYAQDFHTIYQIDLTYDRSIQFSFHGTDSSGVTGFQCRINGGSFLPCSSPHRIENLEVGTHTFEVQAIDSSGNIDPSPATFTWSVIEPVQGLEVLVSNIHKITINDALIRSYSAPLTKAEILLTDNDPHNDVAACQQLEAFINQVAVPSRQELLFSSGEVGASDHFRFLI